MDNDGKKESKVDEIEVINDSIDEVLGKKKKSKAKPIFIGLIVLLIIVVIGIAVVSWNMFGSNEVSVASVNNESITQTDFDAFYAQQIPGFQSQGLDVNNPEQLAAAKQQALETLVNQRLLLQAAAEAGIEVAAEEVQSEYDRTVSQFESPEAFQTALSENNLTEELFRDRINIEMTIQNYLATMVDENVTASDEEIQALYDQYVAQGSNIPVMEEVTTQLADQVKQQKLDTQVGAIIDELKDIAEIELYLE
ncbi:MAG: SurA N-terminal domain-containing protein [Candidatus Komeilibacteria bacterium]